jgi:putative pyruvate formate lyase activating enzyme
MLATVKLAWWGKHFGEEPPLVGHADQGAGTLFFTGCNLRCVFCQNYQISQENLGADYSVEQLADIMLSLQKENAVNIDLVSPTIWWEQIRAAIILAREKGLTIPTVWNSNGYEKIEIIKAMDGLIDIYLPDLKYSNDDIALKYSGIKNYVETAGIAIREMLRQVGHLKIKEEGIATHGLLVRHLILPNNLENSFGVIDHLAQIDKDIQVSLMKQFSPMFHAANLPEINCLVDENDAEQIFNYLIAMDMHGWVQEDDCHEIFIPDFRKLNPFL